MGDNASEQQRIEQQSKQDQITREGNPAHPEGEAGSAMLDRMNKSHAEVTNWALDFLEFKPGMQVLDIGCGGGATMRRLAKRIGLVDEDGAPIPVEKAAGHVTGVDYSAVSCEKSRAFNAAAIAAGTMDVVEASVEDLPFEDASIDAATTVESFYFWPNPEADLSEVARVLKPGAKFLLVADVYRTEGLPQTALDNIQRYNLTVLDPQGYRELFTRAGFASCEVHLQEGTTWICVEGVK